MGCASAWNPLRGTDNCLAHSLPSLMGVVPSATTPLERVVFHVDAPPFLTYSMGVVRALPTYPENFLLDKSQTDC